MESPASPPKRITRARAARVTATGSTAASAAKSKATTTAAAKAKATRAAAATSSSSSTSAVPALKKSTKRKARADEDNEDESEVETQSKRPPPASRTATRATRGRPKKTVEETQPEPAPVAPRRGRPPKKAITDSEPAAPVRATRTRAKKTQVEEDNEDEDADDLAPEPTIKKATRGRPAGTATRASAPTTSSKSAIKKTVTFAEPDKENVLPVTAARKKPIKEPVVEPAPPTSPSTGMRAKPMRKPAGTGRTTRTTSVKRGGHKETSGRKASMPLSPKKVTQLSANRDRDGDSEDELAMDRTPARPFHRSPVKPKSAVPVQAPPETQDGDSGDENGTITLPASEPTVLLGSPVRRPPQSPFKNSMKSPAKRIDGLHVGHSPLKEPAQSSSTPFKASLLQSPAKRPPLPMKAIGLEPSSSRESTISSPFKQSLLQSPAKRGFAPFKPSRLHEEPTEEVHSPAPTPVLLCTPPAVEEGEEPAPTEQLEADAEEELDNEQEAASPTRSDFNGRMSSLLPRDVDPALVEPSSPDGEPTADDECETVMLDEQDQEQVHIFEDSADAMVVDGSEPQDEPQTETETEAEAPGDVSNTPPNSPPKDLAMFGLRQTELVPFDTTYSESEDELTQVQTPHSVSPTKQMRSSTTRSRTSGFGFTPLARRFDEWHARSPHKTPKAKVAEEASATDTPGSQGTFFEDEMCARPEEAANDSANDTDPLSSIPEIKDPVIEDISITDEDLDLAAEANEMSSMSPDQVESMLNLDGHDDTLSEASQEYGDENEVPGQASQNGFRGPPVTPQRCIRREFHTVSKVPLKAADESTPVAQPSLKKRRHSIFRLPVARPTHGLSRSATVISYSPSHDGHVDVAFEEAVEEESQHERSGSVPPPETPTKSEVWSQAGTPNRTPGRDVNPALLRGAVVFVDVHTMEGADASAIFVELLSQMGARCVKTWTWNPNDEDASAKIGITHVVFKDGGKRTMEKVRKTGGVVQCVGVGWVLE